MSLCLCCCVSMKRREGAAATGGRKEEEIDERRMVELFIGNSFTQSITKMKVRRKEGEEAAKWKLDQKS